MDVLGFHDLMEEVGQNIADDRGCDEAWEQRCGQSWPCEIWLGDMLDQEIKIRIIFKYYSIHALNIYIYLKTQSKHYWFDSNGEDFSFHNQIT